MASLPWLK